MNYYARFEEIGGHWFRFDTRIYLGDYEPNESGVCVGAIVGKNPGAAKPIYPNIWTHLDLNRDKMLPSVRNRFIAAYMLSGKIIPENAFVQVWNLFYLCNPKLAEAFSAMQSFATPPLCPSESKEPKITWFAWGGNDNCLNSFKARFLSRSHLGGFYYSHRSGSIVTCTPSVADFAKHTQGMPALPVVNHLASIL